MHEAPRKLSDYRGTGIAADQVESKVSGAARGGGGGGRLGVEEAVEGGPVSEGWRFGVYHMCHTHIWRLPCSCQASLALSA